MEWLVLIGVCFVALALVALLREWFRDTDAVMNHDELAAAAGRGEDVTLNPDQCAALVRQYRQAIIRVHNKGSEI